ncbi:MULTISPECIES: hypothetical protein [unclassified Bacillus (in: firmicutes)]|uniref:hypothetical protein n=1 Tax=unclassified Bacillus (in: firmicutes) TaxID=185979 RepID=UPI001BEB3728|nr:MULTISPECIES: hypothetical protein [unclassified Bacillus (in: firmicutes)]MBT2618623.1 hypothetical protein [Bacillus sp. ISL-78]MBT2628919.1 hypothetical protein [Bacillus sp. ISL-101]MBT2715001.1 hypothetical protein [Bacillus sp. ISL-57]
MDILTIINDIVPANDEERVFFSDTEREPYYDLFYRISYLEEWLFHFETLIYDFSSSRKGRDS